MTVGSTNPELRATTAMPSMPMQQHIVAVHETAAHKYMRSRGVEDALRSGDALALLYHTQRTHHGE